MKHDIGCRLMGIVHKGACPRAPDDYGEPQVERTPVRRLKAQPAAVAARAVQISKVERTREALRLLRKTPTETQVLQATLDRALNLLAVLERQCTGYSKPEVQDAIFAARAMLVEHGRREPEHRTPWVDRES